MIYTQGPVLDRPFAIIRRSYKTQGTKVLLPHGNWNGAFDSGTHPDGTDVKCASYPCSTGFAINWPEKRLAYGEGGTTERLEWFGSQVWDMRDGSGLSYRRNRYYNPETGQFTQVDPIGIAGGLNLYGYANGDPVNFSDPFGLCKDPTDPDCARWILAGTTIGAGAGLSLSGTVTVGTGGLGVLTTPVLVGGSTMAGYAAGRFIGTFDEADIGE